MSNAAVPGSPAAQGPGDGGTVPVKLPVVFCHCLGEEGGVGGGGFL